MANNAFRTLLPAGSTSPQAPTPLFPRHLVPKQPHVLSACSQCRKSKSKVRIFQSILMGLSNRQEINWSLQPDIWIVSGADGPISVAVSSRVVLDVGPEIYYANTILILSALVCRNYEKGIGKQSLKGMPYKSSYITWQANQKGQHETFCEGLEQSTTLKVC